MNFKKTSNLETSSKATLNLSTKLNPTLLNQALLCVTLLGALVFGLFANPTDAAEAPPSPVKVTQVKLDSTQPTATVMGTVFSRNQVQLTAGVTGKLEWVAEPGSYLKKGDRVAQIELLPLQLQLAEQSAQLKRAKINKQFLGRELERQKALRKNNSVSQFQLEQTESQFELAKSDIEIAELKLKQSNQELTRATLNSPFDGVVTQRLRRAGFDVGRGEVLVQLLDTDSLEVRLFVPIKYLVFTRPGSQVTLTSGVGSEAVSMTAIASTIIPAADALSQTFEMRVTIPVQGNEFWAAGQLVKVVLPIASQKSALSVHRDALILRREGTYVVKIDKENKARRLKVIVGKGEGDWVNVKGDLMAGDQVATRGAERLQEGQSVSVQTVSS